MTKRRLDPLIATCPSRKIVELVGSKWAFLLMCRLSSGPVRTGELMRSVEGISQKMLTKTLRDLEKHALVARVSYPEVPPRVDYRLTALGRSLSVVLKELESWILAHFDQLYPSRSRRLPVQERHWEA